MLVFDIETAPDESAIPFLPEPEAPSNYKSADAIEKYVAEAKAKQVSRMALDPSACRIVAIGTCVDGKCEATVCPDVDVERVALGKFWELFNQTRYADDDAQDNANNNRHLADVVGFNCVGFDLPVLLTRSRILGVPTPKLVLRKYGSPDVRDLMLEMSFGGLVDYKSLNFWVKRLKLDVPPDDTTGKDMAQFVEAGDWNKVAHHVTVDVCKTYALAQFIDAL